MSTSLKCGYRVLGLVALSIVFAFSLTFQSDAHFASLSGQDQSKSAAQLIAEADRISASDASDSLNKAVDLLSQALQLYRTAKNPSGEAVALNKLAIAYDSLGNKERALEYYNQSLIILRQTGNRNGEALVLGNIGFFYGSLGEFDRALEYYNQALTIFKATADRRAEALILNNLGRTYGARGEPNKALEYYQQALAIWKATGDAAGEANTLNNLGSAYEAMAEYPKALEFYTRAPTALETIKDRRGQATTLNNIGYLNSRRKDPDAALAAYRRALEIWRELGGREGSATTLENMASLYESQGDKQKAQELITQAAALRIGLRVDRKPTLHILAIGNDHYPYGPRRTRPDMKYPIWNLTTAVNDARGLRRRSRKPGAADLKGSDQFVINAKRAEILNAFDKVIHEIKPQDTFIFSYSGQGFSVPVKGGKREFYLMPTDFTARVGVPAGISATLLRALFTKIQAQHRLIVLDARDSPKDSILSPVPSLKKIKLSQAYFSGMSRW